LSFLAWTLVAAYALVLYRYRARPLGAVTLPLVSLLTFIAVIITQTRALLSLSSPSSIVSR